MGAATRRPYLPAPARLLLDVLELELELELIQACMKQKPLL
jgi:hypothetical protein